MNYIFHSKNQLFLNEDGVVNFLFFSNKLLFTSYRFTNIHVLYPFCCVPFKLCQFFLFQLVLLYFLTLPLAFFFVLTQTLFLSLFACLDSFLKGSSFLLFYLYSFVYTTHIIRYAHLTVALK